MSRANDLISAAPGMVFDHTGFDLPPGFLWPDGGAVSRTTYAALFNALTRQVTGNLTINNPTITGVSADLTAMVKAGMPLSGPGIQAGATVASLTSNSITMSLNASAGGTGVAVVIAPWGVGDGSTTFNKPDLRGRVTAGRDDMGGTAASRLLNTGTGASNVAGGLLGAAGGVDRYTLDATQIPAHTHPIPSAGPANGAGSSTNFWQGPGPASGMSTGANTGGGNAHPIVQPTGVVNKIIKT